MKTKYPALGLNLSLVLLSCACAATAVAQGTSFTYQGRLLDDTNPANGSYDLTFSVWDTAGGPAQIGSTITNVSTPVSNGLFTVTLDFGSGVFDGQPRWLQIAAPAKGGGFTNLSPRQAITAAPYAIAAGNLTGTLPDAGLVGSYASAVTINNPANGFAGNFHGNGGGLSNVNASSLEGLKSTEFWKINGNAGTAPGVNFVGTTDNQALELQVNKTRALRLEPRPVTPNLIGGSPANTTTAGVFGATISGGGQPGNPNRAMGNFSAIGGGVGNLAGPESVAGGGFSNLATGVRVVVAGGALNEATNGLATVSGGAVNLAYGYAAVIAGGGGSDPVFGTLLTNRAEGSWSVISGGRENFAGGESATVSGGERNEATGKQATASGGVGNQSRGEFSTVGGGAFNTADFPASTVSGGQENAALNQHATVGGGVGNYAVGDKATIGGGANNLSTGPYATVPGGQQANPTQYGQLAHAAGMFMNPGDAQRSVFVVRSRTDVAVPIAEMALDGGATRLRIAPNRTLTFDILVVARAEPPLTDSAGYHFRGVVKDNGGLAVFVGLPTATVLGSDVPLWSATIGLAGDSLNIRVNGGGGAGYPGTVRWVGRVDAADVAW